MAVGRVLIAMFTTGIVCSILMNQSLFTSAVQQATKTYVFGGRSCSVWG